VRKTYKLDQLNRSFCPFSQYRVKSGRHLFCYLSNVKIYLIFQSPAANILYPRIRSTSTCRGHDIGLSWGSKHLKCPSTRCIRLGSIQTSSSCGSKETDTSKTQRYNVRHR